MSGYVSNKLPLSIFPLRSLKPAKLQIFSRIVKKKENMLALFEKGVAKKPVMLFGSIVTPAVTNAPEEPPTIESVAAIEDVARGFEVYYPNSLCIKNLPSCVMSSKLDQNSFITPSSLVVKDDVVCLFHGRIENRELLQMTHVLHDVSNDAATVSTLYSRFKSQGDEWYNVVRRFQGNFSFVIYDAWTKQFFVSTDPRGAAAQCFWGTDSHGNLVFSTNWQISKAASAKFYGSVTGGCFVATGKGLRRLESPNTQLVVKEVVASS
ncbi:unnamed protein product [Microthlaspi erraticum]|uniref:DUF3700 domain-containing protein n=1 Tax=Microthlaspi erraticum TaxID=1685480 RepID=A0A6D2HR22_9BRAS|nr:unnamed protein product [Microthlaspi erraticum]